MDRPGQAAAHPRSTLRRGRLCRHRGLFMPALAFLAGPVADPIVCGIGVAVSGTSLPETGFG